MEWLSHKVTIPPVQDVFSHILYCPVLPFPREVLIAACSCCTYCSTSISTSRECAGLPAESKVFKANTGQNYFLWDTQQFFTPKCCALNTLSLSELVCEANSHSFKSLSKTHLSHNTYQKSAMTPIRNRWLGYEADGACWLSCYLVMRI